MTAVALLIALPVFAQAQAPRLVCIGDRVVYSASGLPGSTFEYLLNQPEAGVITQTHFDTIVVEWGTTKGVFQLGVREISQLSYINPLLDAHCTSAWAFIDIEVVGEYAQFTQPSYDMCSGAGVFVDFNKSAFRAYSWVDETVPEDGYITKPGIYELITIDHNNCRLSSFIEVIEYKTPEVYLGTSIMPCETDFTLYARNTENNHPETVYTWSNGQSGMFLTQISVHHDMMEDVKYWVRAEYNGCITSDTVVIRACNLYKIPNTFTPNNDGENDVWNIEALLDYPESIVEIFDRWGRRVFVSPRGYPVPWDGRDVNGRILPMETYYYIIHLNSSRWREPFMGTITIIR